MAMSYKRTKRQYEFSETKTENEIETNHFPTFLVVEVVEGNITKVSPFMLQKMISEMRNWQSVNKIKKNYAVNTSENLKKKMQKNY